MLNEQLQRQIEQEAEAIAANLNDNNDYQAGVINGTKAGYEAAGEIYASKWQEEKELRERYEKALKEIQAKAVFPKTENEAGVTIYDILKLCNEALTPKTSNDEQ